jgi:hypothetical protein
MTLQLKYTSDWNFEREHNIDDEVFQETYIDDKECEIESSNWKPIQAKAIEQFPYVIVDGTEKTHEVLKNDKSYIILGSIAVGAVELSNDGSKILEESNSGVNRYSIQYVPDNQVSQKIEDIIINIGNQRIKFEGKKHTDSTKTIVLNSKKNLMENLTALMSQSERKLADHLAKSYKLVFLDGPIVQPSKTKDNIVGYIKGLQRYYISTKKQLLLPQLKSGERTPIFRITSEYGNKLSWFLCIKKFDENFFDFTAGLMRIEVTENPRNKKMSQQAISYADFTTAIFPSLASERFRDPRSPHNLTPVGELEKRIKHLIGDKEIIDRGIRSYIYAQNKEQ